MSSLSMYARADGEVMTVQKKTTPPWVNLAEAIKKEVPYKFLKAIVESQERRGLHHFGARDSLQLNQIFFCGGMSVSETAFVIDQIGSTYDDWRFELCVQMAYMALGRLELYEGLALHARLQMEECMRLVPLFSGDKDVVEARLRQTGGWSYYSQVTTSSYEDWQWFFMAASHLKYHTPEISDKERRFAEILEAVSQKLVGVTYQRCCDLNNGESGPYDAVMAEFCSKTS